MTVAVIGAGITGLAIHNNLQKAGISSSLFEADNEVGGVIRSRKINDIVVEFGPQRMRLSSVVNQTIDDLGLKEDLIIGENLPLLLYRNGELHKLPLSLKSAIKSDLISWKGKLRVLLEPLHSESHHEETVADFLRRKFGGEIYNRIFDPLYGGIYASNPENMLVRHSLGQAIENTGLNESQLVYGIAKKLIKNIEIPPPCTFTEGLQTLPKELANNNEEIYLENRVREIKKIENDWLIEFTNETRLFDDVIITVPAPEAAELLVNSAPLLAEKLESLNYNPLAVVHIVAEEGPEAMGFQVNREEDLMTLGVTCNAAIFNRDGLHTCFLGGSRNPDVTDMNKTQLGDVATKEFEEVTGSSAVPIHVNHTAMPAWDSSWTAIDDLSLPKGLHIESNYVGRAGIPGRLREAKTKVEDLAKDN